MARARTKQALEQKQPFQARVNDVDYLRNFIKDLLSDLQQLPIYRKNCFGALFKVFAVNKADKEALENLLKKYQSELNSENVKSTADKIAQNIKSYREILVINEGGNYGQSRYLASLQNFLKKRDLVPVQILSGDKILQSNPDHDQGIDRSLKSIKITDIVGEHSREKNPMMVDRRIASMIKLLN